MRPITIFLFVAGAGIVTWLVLSRPTEKAPVARQEAIAVSKHTPAFNNGIDSLISDYTQLSEQFVNWDSARAAATAAALVAKLERLNLDELKKDSAAIYETARMFVENMQREAKTIATEKGIRPQREAFNSFTDNLYQFFNTVNYDRQTLFLQECPMAFDDTKSAQWLSPDKKIRNPYLGLYHPTYGKGMLACGETKTALNNSETR